MSESSGVPSFDASLSMGEHEGGWHGRRGAHDMNIETLNPVEVKNVLDGEIVTMKQRVYRLKKQAEALPNKTERDDITRAMGDLYQTLDRVQSAIKRN
jgi:hypothetical protein